MTLTTTCLCGFKELDDETFADHILVIFTPADSRGADGLIHEEREPLACACGITASAPEELDSHFFRSFTPRNAIGSDGKKHGVIDGA
jgi:hypothetical protein